MKKINTRLDSITNPFYNLAPWFFRIALGYSKDEEQFFKDFSRAFGKLLALGTKQNTGGGGGPLDGLRKLFGL